MIDSTLKKVTVKVTTKLLNKNTEKGSGVIVKNNAGDYFVITAGHCIYGKNNHNTDKVIKPQNIELLRGGQRIPVKKIHKDYITDDIILLGIDSLNGYANDLGYLKSLPSVYNENFHGYGYPAYLNGDSDIYPSRGGKTENNYFQIQSDKFKDVSGCKLAENTCGGLSGSGVFYDMNEKTYLLGIITDMVDSDGTFGQVKVRNLDKVFDTLDFNVHDAISNEFYRNRLSKRIKEESISNYIESFKNTENKYFINLYDKCKVLYGEDVDETVVKLIKYYHKSKIDLNRIRTQNPYYNDFSEDLYDRFESTIDREYNNRTVSNQNEAQELYGQIRKEFKELFKDLNEKTKYNLGMYDQLWMDEVIIYFLMKCTLKFKLKRDGN